MYLDTFDYLLKGVVLWLPGKQRVFLIRLYVVEPTAWHVS